MVSGSCRELGMDGSLPNCPDLCGWPGTLQRGAKVNVRETDLISCTEIISGIASFLPKPCPALWMRLGRSPLIL